MEFLIIVDKKNRVYIYCTMLCSMNNSRDFMISDIKYKLKGNINDPVIHLDNCHNALIYNVNLDGNMEHQQSEISKTFGYTVRNNCISLRNCTNVTIARCTTNSSRSGGIVTALCNGIYIVNCTCKFNYFDGIAPYNSKNIFVINCDIGNNMYSGISIDGNSTNVVVIGSRIYDNDDWGIWYGPDQNYAMTDNDVDVIKKYNIFERNKSGDIKTQKK